MLVEVEADSNRSSSVRSCGRDGTTPVERWAQSTSVPFPARSAGIPRGAAATRNSRHEALIFMVDFCLSRRPLAPSHI